MEHGREAGFLAPDWDALVDEGWRHADDASRLIRYFTQVRAAHPDSSRAHFELANALDYCGREADAIPYYEEAWRLGGLSREVAAYTRIQWGSSLRNVGRVQEAIDVLASAEREYPEHWAASLFLALALNSAGRPQAALKAVMRATLAQGQAQDLDRYRRALAQYIDDIIEDPPSP